MSHYADDAFLVAPGLKGTDGSTEIRKSFAGASADPAFSLTFASDKVDAAASGDMAYSRGHFTEKYTDPKTSKVMTTSGSYVTVYKKQQDGSWKAVEDFAAADPDGTKPVEPAKPTTRAKMTSF
jgi:ketosteroid isomerase-like protein